MEKKDRKRFIPIAKSNPEKAPKGKKDQDDREKFIDLSEKKEKE